MHPLRPIEIVGGGLAGLSLGLALRREQIPVTVFEAGDYPRHRVCGEFISGLSPATVARLGLAPFLRDARRHRRIAWFTAGRTGPRQNLPEAAFGISRYALDARLAEAFRSAGGDLRTSTRIETKSGPPGRVLTSGRLAGRSPWIGLKFHARALPLSADLEVHLGNQAYVGLSGIEDGRVNICGFFHRRAVRGHESPGSIASVSSGIALFRAYLQATGLATLARRLETAPLDPASFSAIAGLVVDGTAAPRPHVRLGDAFAMIAPFTGDGMAMAFQGAELALEPLAAYSRGNSEWPEASKIIRAGLRHQFRTRLATSNALHTFLLRPRRQRWLAAAARAGLLPVRPLYALLH